MPTSSKLYADDFTEDERIEWRRASRDEKLKLYRENKRLRVYYIHYSCDQIFSFMPSSLSQLFPWLHEIEPCTECPAWKKPQHTCLVAPIQKEAFTLMPTRSRPSFIADLAGGRARMELILSLPDPWEQGIVLVNISFDRDREIILDCAHGDDKRKLLESITKVQLDDMTWFDQNRYYIATKEVLGALHEKARQCCDCTLQKRGLGKDPVYDIGQRIIMLEDLCGLSQCQECYEKRLDERKVKSKQGWNFAPEKPDMAEATRRLKLRDAMLGSR